jgi:ABC-type multidrug transport system ATPase subunit
LEIIWFILVIDFLICFDLFCLFVCLFVFAWEQKSALVELMIKELHLESCADTLIGSELIKGISGGEKKRTSVGVELVTNPTLLFLDEPTSGLDSFSAHQCVDLLRKIGQAGCTVMCVIHQPSSEIFQMFDICMILKSGRLIFQVLCSFIILSIASFFSLLNF